MKHDGQLMLSVGRRADTKKWHNKSFTWSELAEKLTTEYRTYETLAEYNVMSKDDQSRIKDVGGFVGGYLKEGRRLNRNVEFRQVLALDLDDARPTAWTEFTSKYPVGSCCYSTHKHTPEKPRLRIIVPLSRKCSPEEYEAVGRRVAADVGLEMFDPTTFQPARLMYWPSTSKDAEFFSGVLDAPWLDVDDVLGSYFDWSDTSEWPRSIKEATKVKRDHDKQENPLDKKGVVGAFCRTYTITEVIAEHLSDIYAPTEQDDRYTFLGGSTSGGLVVYDDTFAYSNHSTDPAGQQLCNAFDLVRLHRFGHLDEDATQSGAKAPSFKAASKWAESLEGVKAELIAASISEARTSFGDDEENEDWMIGLQRERDQIKSCAANFSLVMANDPALKGKFKYNDFAHREHITQSVPWHELENGEWASLEDWDLAGLRNYVETVYGMSAPGKLDDSLVLAVRSNWYHPVKDYLNGVVWDGKKRLDTLLIDYLGAKDTLYTREVARKVLIAAVARIMRPGVKFDEMLVLVGKQGCGKSTFISKLAGEWFSDSFMTVQGKEAYESVQGVWIMEIAELAGLKKAEVEPIKMFVAKQEDRFRPAYGRRIETFKRQCIFVGTTNNSRFLKDPTGNRRFWPVDVSKGEKNLFGDESSLDAERDQIWAEAVAAYKSGESLILSSEAQALAEGEQEAHFETDERAGMIEDWLSTDLPADWDEQGLNERRRYFADPSMRVRGTVRRDTFCAMEVWCELFAKDPDTFTKYCSKEVADAVAALGGWEYGVGMQSFPLYGRQRYYTRVTNDLD